ncbi:serine/threonine protein kinase [Gordonia malaquae]|uniref:non-specific serine/threonine protein kinase n=1 Tax=Gordonia malaquae NBRC 108250 TaxID=1223542 RepID=M3VD24_GORML|nr:serine/threonine-protein kinase [Gordonia malaquae]GAC78124.1 putative serine/threonine protein kinase [Gordonia malaquae NBRC 108250]SED94232.1 serine/threonine protein kinase [Gordonia malaquae]
MSELSPGDVFAGYTIERLLGAGGMGEVFLARHPRLPRSDALKVLAAPLADDDQFRKRFEREADVIAGLSDPHVVKIHDRGETDGRLWIALEYIDGEDLSTSLKRGPLPPFEAARVIGEVGQALDDAAAAGLVHRDVKPANILLDRRGRALLTDFGIAHLAGDASQLTGTGMTLGTVLYASPEQLLGQPIDARSDQYSLACTAFELIAGRPPFSGATPTQVVMAHVQTPPPSAAAAQPGLSPEVDAVLHRALAKNPAHRFDDSRTFAAALAHALTLTPAPTPVAPLDAQTVQQTPPPSAYAPTEVRSATVTKRRPHIGLIVGAIVAVLAVAVVAIWAFPHGIAPSRSAQNSGTGPSDEATGLKRVTATRQLASLATKPTAPRWSWPDKPGFSLPDVLGGTDSMVLMVSGPGSDAKLALVDAESGRTTRTITLPAGMASPSGCAISADQKAAMCAVSRSPGNGNFPMLVDLVAGTSRVLDFETRFDPFVTKSGDVFAVTAEEGVVAYDTTGRKRWSVPPTEGPVRVSTQDSSPVVAVTVGHEATLRRVEDGEIVYRRDTTLGSADLIWQGALTGFVVQEGDAGSEPDTRKVAIFDATGRRTGDATGWTVTRQSEAATVPSLPVLSRGGEVAAFNPATGNQLWSVNEWHSVEIKAGFGTKVEIIVRRSEGETAVTHGWIDCYDGSFAVFDAGYFKSILGTDGDRVAVATDFESELLQVYNADGTLRWQAGVSSSDDVNDLVAAGPAVMLDGRRLT